MLEDFVRWYSPFDWILGPETEEELEELKRLEKNKEKENEESSSSAAGREIQMIVVKPKFKINTPCHMKLIALSDVQIETGD